MRYIAHRGLIDGGNTGAMENHPAQVSFALMLGYDAEIDVWSVDNKWWLGHDRPTYEISYEFLFQDNLWLHCKNLPALYQLCLTKHNFKHPNFFWHEEDHWTLTSHGYIWTHIHNSAPATDRSILLIDWTWLHDDAIKSDTRIKSAYGICSKWIEAVKKQLT